MKSGDYLCLLRTVAALTVFAVSAHPQGVVTTLAGTDFFFPGDGKPGVGAPLGSVSNVALSPDGEVYFADETNFMVMKINADGTLRVMAGNGILGFSGENGPARSASIVPLSVAFDGAGNLYIGDLIGRVRRVTREGTITTVAGGGSICSGKAYRPPTPSSPTTSRSPRTGRATSTSPNDS